MKPYISVVIKPTLYCNESCSHCYHTPGERIPGNISLETLDRLFEMVSNEYQSAWFIWHGGEPMTLPMSFYKSVMELEEKHFGKNTFRVGNTIQTNGTLLNRRFMAYCREKAINVGVSWEGPYNGVLRELDPEKAVSMLSDKDNRYSVSSTISAETALKQKELYRFFRDRGTNLSLSPVIPAGCARCGNTVPDPDDYIRGSIEAFDEWLHDADSKIPLVPHYLYMLNYLGDPTPSDCAHTSCLTKWICVNPDGSIYPCAKACPEEFRMGNVNEPSHRRDSNASWRGPSPAGRSAQHARSTAIATADAAWMHITNAGWRTTEGTRAGSSARSSVTSHRPSRPYWMGRRMFRGSIRSSAMPSWASW